METDGFGALVSVQVRKSHLEKQDKICGLIK